MKKLFCLVLMVLVVGNMFTYADTSDPLVGIFQTDNVNDEVYRTRIEVTKNTDGTYNYHQYKFKDGAWTSVQVSANRARYNSNQPREEIIRQLDLGALVGSNGGGVLRNQASQTWNSRSDSWEGTPISVQGITRPTSSPVFTGVNAIPESSVTMDRVPQSGEMYKSSQNTYYYVQGVSNGQVTYTAYTQGGIVASPQTMSLSDWNTRLTGSTFVQSGLSQRPSTQSDAIAAYGGSVSSCFLSESLITLLGNSKKQIQYIKSGDKVLSYDIGNKKLVISEVLNIFSHIVNDYIIVNDNIKVTPYHYVYAKRARS